MANLAFNVPWFHAKFSFKCYTPLITTVKVTKNLFVIYQLLSSDSSMTVILFQVLAPSISGRIGPACPKHLDAYSVPTSSSEL